MDDRSNVAATLAAYEHRVEAYLADSSPTPSTAYAEFRERILGLLPTAAWMLELGTGPGHDALFFEANGVSVRRTDGARAFVDRLRSAGHAADVLDITADELGGPYDAVFANAVLLHLTAAQLYDVLGKAARAVGPGGLLAFTVKEGDGAAWSAAKLGEPRFFTYWRAGALAEHLATAGWAVLSAAHVQGRLEPWIHLICRRTPTI